MKLDDCVQLVGILFGKDLCLVKSLDFLERLQDRRVRGKHQRIVAETLIFRVFMGKQELVENAERHQDCLACPHGERKDVVCIFLPQIRKLLKERNKRVAVRHVQDRKKSIAVKMAIVKSERNGGVVIRALNHAVFTPVVEQIGQTRISQIFLEEHIHFKRFVLRLPQKSVRVVLARFCVCKNCAGKICVRLSDFLFVCQIELPHNPVERKID